MIELFDHNQKAYEAAKQSLSETGKAAIVHPTGTGKSFIGFKFCEERSDERICWLGPSTYIFDTQIENLRHTFDGYAPENIHFLTYAKLMLLTDEELAEIQPNLIILDEFHRCGAEQWGIGVSRLLAKYFRVPVLGLSATAIRYLDNQRDMAEELFNGNIASEISLGEAIVRGILRAPKYVLTAYSYQRDLERYEKRIKKAPNAAVRDSAEQYLEELRRALEMADGLDEIFARHMPNVHGKYIVFCANAGHMQEMIALADEWFAKVDSSPKIYSAYSSDPETSKAFADFKADQSEHLKLLYCIDMLNEGIHVDDINGVILLRPTVSPIIYKQQIGRTMSVSQRDDAVIFDVVMNIANLQSIGAIQDEMNAAMDYYRSHGEGDKIIAEHFKVWDELRNCRELFASLDRTLSSSWDLMYALACEYHEEHGNLNIPYDHLTPEGYALGKWLATQKNVRKGLAKGALTDDQIQKLDALGINWDGLIDGRWNQKFNALCAYYEEHGDLDVPRGYIDSSGVKLYEWVKKLRTYRSSSLQIKYLTPERIAALDSMGMIWDKTDHVWERNYEAAVAYYQEHGSLNMPHNYKTPDGIRLFRWVKHTQDVYRDSMGASLTEEQKTRLEAIGMKLPSVREMEDAWQKGYLVAREFSEVNGHLDVPLVYKTESGFNLGRWIAHERTIAKQNANSPTRPYPLTHKFLLDQIGMSWERQKADSWMQHYVIAQRYYAEHHNLDVSRSCVCEDVWLGDWLIRQRHDFHNGNLSEERVKLLNALGFSWDDRYTRMWDEAFQEAKSYFDKTGNLSVPATEKPLYTWIVAQRRKFFKGKLSQVQIDKLNSIGMRWNRRKTAKMHSDDQ